MSKSIKYTRKAIKNKDLTPDRSLSGIEIWQNLAMVLPLAKLRPDSGCGRISDVAGLRRDSWCGQIADAASLQVDVGGGQVWAGFRMRPSYSLQEGTPQGKRRGNIIAL